MEPLELFADALGPAKVIHVSEPSIGLRGTLVVDNVAAGPSIGGLRMAPDVGVEECRRLARAMTLKNASARLPHGGGKSVLLGDPAMPREDKERLIRGFAHALRNETDYIFGPDMGTDEQCMAWVRDEIGRSVGLPREIGGIPLDEIGATGWGVLHASEAVARRLGFPLAGARVVVQGFGAVGRHAARFLSERGAVLVAAADSRGAVRSDKGLDVEALSSLKASGKSVLDAAGAERIEPDELLEEACDLWIPAARPDVIREDNAGRLRARAVVPGANIAVTDGAERSLHARGVVVLPDFIANAGGVICAAMEYHGSTQSAVFARIEETVRANTEEVLDRSQKEQTTPRDAAVAMAMQRVQAAMQNRRWSIF